MGKQKSQDKKDIAYLDELAQQNVKAQETPSRVWVIMVLVGLATSGLPVALFFTSYYSVESLDDGAPFFTVGAMLSSVVMAFAYNLTATKVRKELYAKRESVISEMQPFLRAELVQTMFTESTSQAMFYQNIAFFVLYYFFSCYFLSGFVQDDDKLKYLLSSILASAATFGCAHLVHSINFK